ncbi:MAG: MerR family transcriptional regulator [Clostridiales bacterium]|nr:MerR family transcriptional regulator [Clostridiales bacterium]
MKEFLPVKEFSKLSGIETTTLRYWDEIGLFSPAKRDPDNNYRYYTPVQIIQVNFISVLSHLQVPLKTIAEIEQTRTPESIMDLIDRQEHQLDRQMRQLRECYSIIHTRRELIKRGLRADPSKLSVEEMPERWLIIGPENNFQPGEAFYVPFMRFCDQASALRMNLSYPIGGMHTSFDRFLADPGRPDHFYSIDPTGNVTRKAGKYLVGYTKGYYGVLEALAQRMTNYAKEHGLTLTGPAFATYLHEETCMRDPDAYLSQVSVAVE